MNAAAANDDCDRGPEARLVDLLHELGRETLDAAICLAIDAKSRKRIVDTWLSGWCTGDEAMRLLVTSDLIEHDPELAKVANA